jgi:hypothetical protein
MGLIEDELRDTFATRVRHPPAVQDVADRAIRAGGRIRRRRTALSAAAVVVSVVLAGAGATVVADTQRADTGVHVPPPSGPALPGSARPTIDVLFANEIITSDARSIKLAGLPPARRAYRIDEGWLVQTFSSERQSYGLYLVDLDERVTHLVDGRQIVVSPDGTQVGWSKDGTVSVARLGHGRLSGTRKTTGTGSLGPVGFVAEGILLGGAPPGGDVVRYDMWFPGMGKYRAGPQRVGRTFGPTADGKLLFGLVGEKKPCLAEIDPNSLRAIRSACVPGLTPNDAVFPSPDGRWLAVAGPDRVDLLDLSRIWKLPAVTKSWPGLWAVAVADGNGAWLDAGTFVLGLRQATVRLSLTEPDTLTYDYIRLDDSETVVVIPRLG